MGLRYDFLMDLTADEIRLIRETFALLNLISKTVAKQFYNSLFDLDPTLRAYFPADLTLQQMRLITTLQVVVETLDHPELFPQAVLRLVMEHRELQIEAFVLFGQALLSTVQLALGRACTPAVYAAWARAYEQILAEIQASVLEST